ncbi:hypothetical protein R1T40_18685 [Tritonibacter scottomollicae]|uniref:Uncharacterized protein n=1 Tax=Tritonibacter scottomollicae TaxID=483013 RepID=A0ABZ0HE76_TRISK|nr:hypothetical protein R1T40_18685 [Tritonibacter scottomollicae]
MTATHTLANFPAELAREGALVFAPVDIAIGYAINLNLLKHHSVVEGDILRLVRPRDGPVSKLRSFGSV